MFVSTRTIIIASLATALVPAFAHAETDATPAAPAAAPKKVHLSAGLLYGMPQGDFKELAGMDLIGNSPGIALSGGYMVIPNLSVVGALRYFAVSSEIDGVDQSTWDIGVGARYAYPVSPVLSVYGEGLVQRVSYSADAGGGSSDYSGFGFAVGGGVSYMLKENVSLGGGLSYSAADIEPEMGESQSSGWLSLNAFAAYHL